MTNQQFKIIKDALEWALLWLCIIALASICSCAKADDTVTVTASINSQPAVGVDDQGRAQVSDNEHAVPVLTNDGSVNF